MSEQAQETEPGLSIEQFQINHLNGRISQLVSDYERQMSVAALRIQILKQQLATATQELADARAELDTMGVKMEDIDEVSDPEPKEQKEENDEEVPGD